MERLIVWGALMASGIGWWVTQTAVAQQRPVGQFDQMFVQKAVSSGLAAVQLGKMAIERAASAEVQQFGQRMIDDHTQANNILLAIAQARQIPVTKAPEPHYQIVARRLAALRGAEFDRVYMVGQVADHEQAMTLFTTEATQGQDPELKAFAAQALPILQGHMRTIHDLTARLRDARVQR
jgi:putative membrane protein